MVGYLVATPPSVSALTDYRVPHSSPVSGLLDSVATHFGSTPAVTDYGAGDAVSKMADYTPAATLVLVVEHFSVHGAAVGAVIGDPQQNPCAVGAAIESTDRVTGACVGMSIASEESTSGAAVGFVVGQHEQATGSTVGFNVGTPDQNVCAVGSKIETVNRRLDVEVSVVSDELAEVEEEP